MKKILFLIICAFISLWVFAEQSYATTAFFTTRDGRVFCESDNFDGSYRLCTKEQSTGTGLVKAERYNARMVETTTWRICVEDGTEVSICSDEAKIVVPVATGWSQIPISNINTVTPSSSGEVAPSNNLVASGTVANTKQEAVITEPKLFASIIATFNSCFGSAGTMSCGKAITKMTDAFVALGTFSIIGIILLFFGSTIFWFNMISHAFSHPIPVKPLWIAILLILSVPGAILYYFWALRPYDAMIIASSPPRPPSFFY